MTKLVQQAELADIFGRDDTTIQEWQKLDPPLPIFKRGDRGQANLYRTADVIAWYVERETRKVGARSPRDVGIELDNKLKALNLAERDGTLVPAADVEPLWRNWVRTAAAFMAGRHSRLAAMLEAAPGLEAKRELIKASDQEFLCKLGVDGADVQREVAALFEASAAQSASALLKRIAGDDNK